MCHRTALAELVGKAGSFPRRGLLRIRPAEDSKSSREREKPSIRGADRVHGRGRSTSVVCQNPLGRLSSVKRLRNFASANSRACLRALRFRALTFRAFTGLETRAHANRRLAAPKRLCAARTPQGFEKLLSIAVQPLSVDDRSALLPRLYASLVRCPS